MGIMRLMAAASLPGLVDPRSPAQRTARYTRQTRNAARTSVRVQRAQLDAQQALASTVATLAAPTTPTDTQPSAPVRPRWDAYKSAAAPNPSTLVEAAPYPSRYGSVPRGWYPDPTDSDQLRWWTGTKWDMGIKKRRV